MCNQTRNEKDLIRFDAKICHVWYVTMAWHIGMAWHVMYGKFMGHDPIAYSLAKKIIFLNPMLKN